MSEKIEIEIQRDAQNYPTEVTVKKKGKKLQLEYLNQGQNVKLLGNTALLDVLKLIYPFQPQTKFNIPQPLPVQNVAGGQTILYDDIEDLLKWNETAVTVAVDNTRAYGKNQSLKITSTLAATAIARRYIPLPPNPKKISYSCMWGVDDFSKLAYIAFTLASSDTQYIQNSVITFAGDRLYCMIPPLATVEVPNTYLGTPGALTTVGGAWHSFKCVLDIVNHKYLSIGADDVLNENVNLSTLFDAAAGTHGCYIDVQVKATAGNTVNAWIDDVLVTAE